MRGGVSHTHAQVLVEAERLRPGLELLLAEADYVVTSAHFPQDWTGRCARGTVYTPPSGQTGVHGRVSTRSCACRPHCDRLGTVCVGGREGSARALMHVRDATSYIELLHD